MPPCLSIFQQSVVFEDTHTHAHADFSFFCVCCSNDTESLRLQGWDLGTIAEDEDVQVVVCLVCNIHFPRAVYSLIRPACLSSELWQEVTCGGSPLIASE